MKTEDLPKALAASGALEILERLRGISGGDILDVATGDGGFIDTLMKALKGYSSITGIDNYKKNLRSARKRFKGQSVAIREMNAEALDFADATFDTVSISYSLHHLENVAKVLAEMRRVLKPGGLFIVQEMYCDGEQTKAQKNEILWHHWNAEIDSLLGVSHRETLTRKGILRVFDALQLKDVEVFETSHPVKCLFCDEIYVCDNPKHEKLVGESLEEFNKAVRRLRRIPDTSLQVRLRKEGEQLQEKTVKFGSAAASQLFLIGRK